MDLRFLRQRLLVHLRARIHSGDITERNLAYLSGLSQPHLHNVLKGARSLSIEMADQIIKRLQIDLLALAVEDEGAGNTSEGMVSRRVPLLEGAIGPGHSYPRRESHQPGYIFSAADLNGLESPVAAWVVRDPEMPECWGQGGVILLDRSEWRRSHPDEESYYAMDLGQESAIRRLGQYPLSLGDRPILEVVRGRVSLLVVHL